ncbi:MAG: hypothetical protein CMH52_03585 [Myxococcales bacterium]|nr:hypothetical protein [Myxococcales bacterium]
MIQFGPFLLFEQRHRGQQGHFWRGVSVQDDGFQSVVIQQLKSNWVNHENIVKDLITTTESFSENSRKSLCPIYDFGMVGKDYYIAGHIPPGHTVGRLLARCDALQLAPSISLMSHLATQALAAIDDVLASNGPAWAASFDVENLWIDYAGHLRVGWDGLRILKADQSKMDHHRSRAIDAVVDWFGTALINANKLQASHAIPDEISEWLRHALSRDSKETLAGQLTKSLLEISPPFDTGDLAMLESLFKRERAVEQAKERRQQQQLASIPNGARRVISQASSQVLAVGTPRQEKFTVEPVQRVEIPAHALYQGDVSGLHLPRLIYRYAVTRVTGQLQLHGSSGHIDIHWVDGAIVRTRAHSHGKRLADYIADRGLVSRDDLVTAGLSDETDESALIKGIVALGRVGYHALLEALQAYSSDVLIALCGRDNGPYFFSGEMVEQTFTFEPNQSIFALLNHGMMARTPQAQIDGFISANAGQRLVTLEHRFLNLSDIRLGTRQLRVWNSVSHGLTVSEQLNRLTALPGIDTTYASRVLAMMHQLDFLSLSESIDS